VCDRKEDRGGLCSPRSTAQIACRPAMLQELRKLEVQAMLAGAGTSNGSKNGGLLHQVQK